MYSPIHATTGLLLATAIPNPALAFLAGVGSHYILDAIPHGDEVEVALGGDGEDESGPALDPNRRLCGDGACLGVIDGDNRCPVCGKPAGS